MEKAVNWINEIIWSPALVFLLVAAGLYFTIRSRFVQVRKFGTMLRLLLPKKEKVTGGVSSFEAFCIALSGRVGTGNIVGVATAIALGGPGAVFWMWIIAFLGAATAFTESTLAKIYCYEHRGKLRGGPFAYIRQGLKSPFFAAMFAIVTALASGTLLTTVQSNGMAMALNNSFGIPKLLGGIILASLIALVVVGGMHRISKVASIVTPFMALVYILVAFVVLFVNRQQIPSMFALIFSSAFGAGPVCGGMMGSAIMLGTKRGLFSNEAGQGSGAIPSASAVVNHPVEQGLAQAFSVYVDTLLVCTATALMILSAGTFNVFDPATGEMVYAGAPELGNNYAAFTQNAVDSVLPGFGNMFVGVSLCFFVFTTVMAYYFNAESGVIYLFRGKSEKTERIVVTALRIVLICSIVFGAVKEANLVWTLGDIGVGLMAWINVVSILLLSPKVFGALKDFEHRHD